MSASKPRVKLPEFPALVLASGPLAGTRYLLREQVTRVGRAADNDVVISGADAAVVSGHHVEIRREGEDWHIADLSSTNGTLVNGKPVAQAPLIAPCSIQLGNTGPELVFVFDDGPQVDLNQTLQAACPPSPAALAGAGAAEHEQLLDEAIQRARIARRTGANQTLTIMREVLDTALHRSSRRFHRAIVALFVLLLAVSSFAFWRIRTLQAAKAGIDTRIQDLEARLSQAQNNPAEADQLIDSLDRADSQARVLEQNMLYRFTRTREDFVTREIRTLLAEFGAEVYSVPPEFRDQVERFLKQYQGPDRPTMEKALGAARPIADRMREIFEQHSLPSDLAYMVLVESALDNSSESSAGAAGFWQFTPATARQYGLRTGEPDDRYDLSKSTRAACKYIRDLILDFGSGSSVMLALAAYNVGPAKVKQAIHRLVQDPIKERSFWYLYRRRALPIETREYVPKVIAAMIIGRHPGRFGF